MVGALRSRIDAYYVDTLQKNPFFQATSQGTLTAESLQNFLKGAHFLVQHTPIHLRRAEQVCRERGRDALAKFFSQKREEESGHDRWAEQDLVELSAKYRVGSSSHPASAIIDLVKYIESIIEEDPALYLPYIFLAEYIVVIMAPKLISDLENRCGFTKDMISIVGNHAELDKNHIEHDLDAMAGLVSSDYQAPFLNTLEKCLSLYDDFYGQVCENSHAIIP